MKTRKPNAAGRRSCRLGPHWVTIDVTGERVAGVALGTRGRCEERGLARDLEVVLSGGRVPGYLRAETRGLPEFTRRVLERCARIRPGQVMTYSGLAKAVGHPGSARAVGQVMANNPFALLIPCHRVVGSDNSLHGFGGGLAMKEWLLEREGWTFKGSGSGRRLKRSQKSDTRSQDAEVPDRRPTGAARRAGSRG